LAFSNRILNASLMNVKRVRTKTININALFDIQEYRARTAVLHTSEI